MQAAIDLSPFISRVEAARDHAVKRHVMAFMGPTRIGKSTTLGLLMHLTCATQEMYSDPEFLGADYQLEALGARARIQAQENGKAEAKEAVDDADRESHDVRWTVVPAADESEIEGISEAEYKNFVEAGKKDEEKILAPLLEYQSTKNVPPTGFVSFLLPT